MSTAPPPTASSDPASRAIIMAQLLEEITSHRYQYSLSKGFYNWGTIPPPPRTGINCLAAANLAKRLAEEKYGLTGLQVVSVAPNYGFIVVAVAGLQALGTNDPEIITPELKCWEFDKHYRVKDPLGFDKVYDPTFGSSGNLNPISIVASGQTKSELRNGKAVMVSEYGEKYRITRGINMNTTVETLKQGPVERAFVVDDSMFH